MDDGYEAGSPSRTAKIVKHVLRGIFFGGLALMLAWFGLRGCLQAGTAAMKRYLVTEEAAAAFREGSLTARRLADQNGADVERIFYIDNIVYTEETAELQFMIRFNARRPSDDSGRESVFDWIEKNGRHSFTFLLTDNRGNVYPAYRYVTDSRLMYGYYRLVFAPVDFAGATVIHVCVFPDDGAAHSPADAWERLVVWRNDGLSEPYAVPENASEPTPGLLSGQTKLKTENDETNGDS